jgi:hypothetical protein
MSEWISVNDRLPDIGQSVLIIDFEQINPKCTIHQSMYVAWIEKLGIENKPCWQYSWCCGCYVNNKVTHWRLLPEPPKDCTTKEVK